MKKTTTLIPATMLLLTTGCDVPWNAVSAALAVVAGEPGLALLALNNLDDDDGENWWDNNDEHFDWHWWPFN